MRFRRLHLRAIGPFTDVDLDLSGGEEGLHIVLGANEAGKTSALRALGHLLFGFPTQNIENDRFLHDYESLRIGAGLAKRDGETLYFIRRKGVKNTLRAFDDSTVLPPETLDRFLGGLDRSAFETMFGIDHARLRKAGEEIREGKGRIGEMLFASGAGLASLRQAQQSLQGRIDDLFKPQGKNQKINQRIEEYNKTIKELKKIRLSRDEWKERKEALVRATAESDRVRARLGRLRGDQARLSRLSASIPSVARLARLRRELEELGEVVSLREDFGGEAREAIDALRLAERSGEQARHALENLERRLAEHLLPTTLLDAGEEIDALQERLGAIEKAKTDRVRLDGFIQHSAYRARGLLREIGRTPVLEEAERALLRADEPAAVRVLGERRAELRGQSDEAKKTIARQEKTLARLTAELAALPIPKDVAELRLLVEAARKKAGDIDDRIAKASEALALAEENVEKAVRGLPRWSGSAEELSRMVSPLDAEIKRLETEFQETDRERKSLDERAAALEESIRDWRAKLSALRGEGDVPGEDDLQNARRLRDDGWRRIRAAWLEGDARVEPLETFREAFPTCRSPAEAFEQSVRIADELADRLRREADRVGRKSEASAQLSRQEEARKALEGGFERLEKRRARIEIDWQTAIGSLGVSASSPAELRDWLLARDGVIRLMEKEREARRELESLKTLADEQVGLIRTALDGLDEPVSLADRRLATCLEHAGNVIDRADRLIKKREDLEIRLREARDALVDARDSFENAEAELNDWRAQWSSKMACIGLEADADPAQAAIILDKLQALGGVLQELRSHESRVTGIDRDAEAFRRDVESLVERVAPTLAEGSAAEQARELSRLLKEARDLSVARKELLTQRDQEKVKFLSAENQREAARDRLARLCSEAGRSAPEELNEAERRSADFSRIKKDLRECEIEIELSARTAGEELSRFLAEVESANAARLAEAIESLEKEIAEEEGRLKDLDQTIGIERARIDFMEGGDDHAAAEAERAQTILATLRAEVERYAVLKFAALALQRGIERHREKNQGSVLARAGKLFADLTCRSFRDLQLDEDKSGKPVPKGVRDDGRSIGVEAMSDGTCDQLFLALRLAYLESWLQTHEPIPFVIDDVLINFDDDRTVAALKAFADLSKSTQVLFFTHHDHVVDLARKNLVASDLFVHELPARGAAQGGKASKIVATAR